MQKICIIGDGLTGLTAAIILNRENIKIDLYANNINKYNSKKDDRATAVSESNYQFIQKELNLNNSNLFWPCKKINLFFEDGKKIVNFLSFKEKNKNFMYIFQNKELKKKLIKIILKKRNIKLIKKRIKNVNHEEGSIYFDKKKITYDLIILCIGSRSKLYDKIEQGRSIEKNYKELSLTTIIKHNSRIKNASQFFLKEGPLAILPFHKKMFSVVWTVSSFFFQQNNKDLKKILKNKIKVLLNNYSLKNMATIKSFPIYLNLKTKYFKKNVLIFGDGLHAVHPMAGQGFNLVLRDIKKLNESISKILKLGLLIRDSLLLKDFYYARKPENNILGLVIDLTNFFFKDIKYFISIRKVILKNINNFGFIKKISQSISDKGISV